MTSTPEPLDYAKPKPAARIPTWERVIIWLMFGFLLLPALAAFIFYLAGVDIAD
jgi:hypothetical protein